MIRRWLIRGPCLVALALVVGVWVTSYFGLLDLSENWRCYWLVGAIRGSAYMIKSGHWDDPADGPHFYFLRGETATPYYPVPNTLGFYAGPVLTWGWWDSLEIVFPLWLPTLLLAGLNWIVWRKTRATYNGRGFPVEPTAKAKEA